MLASEIAEALGTSASHIRVLQLRALRRATQLEAKERKRPKMQEQNEPFDAVVSLLTPASRRVLDLARTEMITLAHWWIGTEHLLWGLASEGSLASFIGPLGITPERVHAGIVFIFDHETTARRVTMNRTADPQISEDPLKMLTPRTKKVIVLAGEEAKSQGEQSIRPVHLLLGMMNEGEGIGAGLLRSLGISLLQARIALAPPTTSQKCSFCGRSGSQVEHFFPSEVGATESGTTTPTLLICDHCVRRFFSVLGNTDAP